MVGGQTSLTVGLSAAIIATVIGSLWGAISGYAGGLVDSVMMRTVDVLLSIPTLFLLLFMATIFQPTRLILIIIIAAVSWLVTSRLIRGETLSLKVREYVQAAKVMGASGRYVDVPSCAAQRDRHDRGERHVPGRRRHLAAGGDELPRPRRPGRRPPTGAACSRTG